MSATWTAVDGTVHELSDQDRLDALRLYISYFAGRDDCYAAWGGEHWITACAPGCPLCRWKAAHRGDELAKPPALLVHDRAPLTPAVVEKAFTSKRPVSAYPMALDSSTHIAALDVDLEDGLMIADRVALVMTKAGAPAYIEPSRRGAHLWCLIDRDIPAIAVRRALRAFLEAAGVGVDNPKIELRPSQDRLSGPEGVGNCLRMPLMPHQSAEYDRVLMAPRGRVVARKVHELVLEVEWAPARVILDWSERWQPKLDPRAIPPAFRKPRRYQDDEDDGTTASQLLAEAGVVVRRVPGAVICPFHDDHNPSLSIARDDRRVWCKNPSCEANGIGGKGLGTHQLRKLLQERRRAA